ncbi:MAG TPA: ABC transporter substrate-binding protein [Gaiellaceae bacterium]|nr:ABC transporter substrate-binding protein [Gaiellaceae bacterium]
MTRSLPALALAALALAGIASATSWGTPGVTPTSIAVGSSGPLTGEAAAAAGVLKGAAAYFAYVNARGGVNGRRIDFTYLDDADDPAQTLANVQELVRQDGVFALFSIVGTNENLAVRDAANAAGVPQVFSASGATSLGRDGAAYPWTIGYPPTYAGEGELYAKHILATAAKQAKIAVLYQSDAYGKELLGGLRRGLGAKARSLIVQTAGYDPAGPDVQAQVAALRASGANTFMIFASGAFAQEAFADADTLRWRPQIYVASAASASSLMALVPARAAAGAISILWSKDPAAPVFRGDAGVALAARIAGRYLPHGTPTDGLVVAGMAEAYSFVDAVHAAGRNLTREGLMRAVTHLNEASNPFLIPGVTVRTTPASRFPITAVQLQRWHGGHWEPFGGVDSVRP